MNLAALLGHVPALDVQGPTDRSVHRVTRDSREASADCVFVAIRGATVDGHDLVEGVEAAAVVVERPVEAHRSATVIRVASTHAALAQIAAALHGYPGRALQVVGVTGTNGKTTLTTLVHTALQATGRAAGRIGTAGHAIGAEELPARFTTPEAPVVQGLLARMRDAGVGPVAMEVSSIGLAQRRVDGIDFHLGVFTNLSRDHLDFHGDMEAYLAAKRRLFTELLRPVGGGPRALLCADDPAWPRLGAPSDRWLYGFDEAADVAVTDARLGREGMSLSVRTPAGEGTLSSRLLGRHNAQNLAGALGALLCLGVPLDEACAALGRVAGVPGRLEIVPDARGRLVVVDYAHSDDALAHALDTVRAVTAGAVWVVFGCGGDRDRTKRPIMGRVAHARADRVVVTSDNPRSEDPDAIIADIVAGLDPSGVIVEPDRAAAIGLALAQAAPGDTVLIAGKGHETYQEIAGVRHPFDDRAVARAAGEDA